MGMTPSLYIINFGIPFFWFLKKLCLDTNQDILESFDDIEHYLQVTNLNLFTKDDTMSGSSQEKESGKGMPFRNDLNSTKDRSGCEKGASCAAPLTVANERISP